jgi:antirestriction protein ArdC
MNGYQKINEMITQRMIDRITETNELPWKKPWTSFSLMPRNLVTKKNYRGVNVFLLHSLDYASPYFLSMKQVNAMGGKVRKGEHACPVVFWKYVEPEEEDQRGYAFLRYYRVFNVEQCEGLPESKVPVIEIPKRKHEPLEIAERLVAEVPNPPVIRYGCRNASYSPSRDMVSMPDPERFDSMDGFYSGLFHELGHSSGAEKRLARKSIMEGKGFGSHAYSQEELVAEMTAAFLCGYCGILMTTESNQAAYLKGWLKRLKSDPTMLVKAGCQAQKAFEYIMGDAAQAELQEAA